VWASVPRGQTRCILSPMEEDPRLPGEFMDDADGGNQPGKPLSRGTDDDVPFSTQTSSRRAHAPGRTTLRDIVAYLLASAFVGGVYMGLLFLMDSVVRTPTAASITVAYVSAMAVYFLLSKLAVFKSHSKAGTRRELIQFTVVVTVNYFLTQLIVHGIERFTGEVYSGSLVAGVVTISLTYVVFDRIVFRK
jgi:putative flippase GtrA